MSLNMNLGNSLSNSLAKKKKCFIVFWKETVCTHVQEFTIRPKYFCFEYLSAAVPMVFADCHYNENFFVYSNDSYFRPSAVVKYLFRPL